MNEKWFSLSIPDIEKKLKTNAASGLSPKAARSRFRKKNTSFYIKPKRSIMSMLGELLTDFTLVLLIISSVVALCFDEYTTGLTLAVIIVLNLVTCLFLCFRTQRLFESLSAFFSPSITVIRSGKAFSIDPEHVVEGDVVLIGEGDILCFDARLVTSDNLKMSVKIDRNTEQECEKLAEGCVKDNEHDIRNMVNMVHAGSTVLSGGARAIVTGVGRYTYYGAMTGGVKLPEVRDIPQGLKLLRKYCSGLGMVLTLLIIPFSLLSMLFSHGNVTLMTTFTASLAIAASSMSQLACTACRIFFERTVRKSLEGNNPCVIRSVDIMDKLASAEYLFLLDGSASCDGMLHFSKAVSSEGEHTVFNAVSPTVKTLAELAFLYSIADSKTLTTGVHAPGRYSAGLREFVDKIGIDGEALKIRCNISGYATGNSTDNTDKLFFFDRGEKKVLCVSSDCSILKLCKKENFSSLPLPMSADRCSSLEQMFLKYTKEGSKVLVFAIADSEFSNELTFCGMIVLSEQIDVASSRAMATLTSLGVKTISFVNFEQIGKEGSRGVEAPLVGKVANLSDFIANKVPITYMFGTMDTYCGLSAKHVDKLIAHIHSMNKKVAVVCFSDAYKKLAEKPDIFVSCSELQYRFSGHFEEEIEAIEVAGHAESRRCRDDLKVESDIVIPRPADGSGGLMSLRRAFLLSCAAYNNLGRFFRYMLCSQFIRIVTILLPMLSGNVYLDARHAIFCGFVIDILAMLTFAFDRANSDTAGSMRRMSGEFVTPIRNNAGIIIASAIGGISALLIPNVVGAIGFAGQYFYQTEYLFISVIFLQLTVIYCIRADRFKKLTLSSINKFAIALVAIALLAILLCFSVEPIGILFDIREITVQYFFMAIIPSAVCAILFFTVGKFRIKAE